MARPSPRRRGYNTRWDKARAGFLAAHPHCATCAREGRQVQAVHVHHSTPHRGDARVFWDKTRWVPLCAPCHNQDAQHVETRGYSPRVGRDGLPTDPSHPFNRPGPDPQGGRKVQRLEGAGPAQVVPSELVAAPGGA